MSNITVVKISGPPGGYKTVIAQLIKKWAAITHQAEVYIIDGNNISGDKEAAKIHVVTEQTS